MPVFSHSAKLQVKSFPASVGLKPTAGSSHNLCPPQYCPAPFAGFTSSLELHSLKGNLYLTSQICRTWHLTWAAYCEAAFLGSCPKLLLCPTQIPHLSPVDWRKADQIACDDFVKKDCQTMGFGADGCACPFGMQVPASEHSLQASRMTYTRHSVHITQWRRVWRNALPAPKTRTK